MLIKLYAGLGNQMFIYAFARALSLKGYPVVIDATSYINNIHPSCPDTKSSNNASNARTGRLRLLELSLFNIQLPLCLDNDYISMYLHKHDKQLKQKIITWRYIKKIINFLQGFKYIEPYINQLQKNMDNNIPLSVYKHVLQESLYNDENICLNYYKKNSFNNSLYIKGYFQNLIYFDKIESILKEEFRLKIPLQSHNQQLKTKIENTENSVFLHVRLGDYISDGSYVRLGKTYYQRAIDIIKEKVAKPHIFIFSNDIEWCEKNICNFLNFNGCNIEFIKGNSEGNAAEEMELMRACKHAIIANSTFSWWAAYLIDNPNKQVIMPNQFLNSSYRIPKANMLTKKGFILLDPIWG